MKLIGLQTLYRSMRDHGMGRVKFRYTLNHLAFECLFFADVQPFELVMGLPRVQLRHFRGGAQGIRDYALRLAEGPSMPCAAP